MLNNMIVMLDWAVRVIVSTLVDAFNNYLGLLFTNFCSLFEMINFIHIGCLQSNKLPLKKMIIE